MLALYIVTEKGLNLYFEVVSLEEAILIVKAYRATEAHIHELL